jgi:hypothetical protein
MFIRHSSNRTDRLLALILFAAALGLYLRTLAPGLLDGDSGEFQFAAWRLGLAHPTGYPFYMLLGSAWQHLSALVGISPATALNALSAVIGAASVALVYRVTAGWLQGPDAIRRSAAFFTGAMLAANPTFWSQSLIAEVYTLHVFFVLLIFALYQRFAAISLLQNPSAPDVGKTAMPSGAGGALVALAALAGLALTHHAMTLLLVPGLLLALWLHAPAWPRSLRLLGALALAGVAPLLLYGYIPLRSGPAASPWYHQRLGEGTLALYTPSWQSFIDFVSGRSISVGFHTLAEALAQLPLAALLWREHFTWAGLALSALGVFTLLRQRRWPLLALTLGYIIVQQIFNLFYAIGDILVYYIPLYLIGIIWAGMGAHAIGSGFAPLQQPGRSAPLHIGAYFVILLLLLPLWLVRSYEPRLDQGDATAARQMWEEILAARPPPNAILVSNDRNEIVPLFYLQYVEARAMGMAGLFPLIKADKRFLDIGATVETALVEGGGRPVYLVKPMPGLEVKYDLRPAAPPLVAVEGPAAFRPPQQPVEQTYGPLRLLGYDLRPLADAVHIDLHWSVIENPLVDYTTTVQVFDAEGEKIGQDDQPPGGAYYPTSRWKPGETLVDSHTIAIPAGASPASVLIGMYSGPDLAPLAPFLVFALPQR